MKPLIAKMNELVETDNTNIIGTFGLATCSALILYDKNKTVLGHITIDFKPLIRDMVKHFEPGIIGAIIVPGEYTTLDNIQDVIAFLNNHHEFFKNDFNITIKNLPDFINPGYSVEFGFNPQTKEFIHLNFDEIWKGETNGRN